MNSVHRTATDSAPLVPQVKSWRDRLGQLVTIFLTAVVIVGVLAGLVRDRFDALAVVYYAMPWQVVLVLTLVLVVWQRRERHRGLFWGFSSLLLVAMIYLQDWGTHPDRSEPGDLKVVFWNAYRMQSGWDPVIAEITSWDADVIALVEAGRTSEEFLRKWRSCFPEYNVTGLSGGMLLLTRGEAGPRTLHEFHLASRAREIDTTVNGLRLKLFVVDIESSPHRSRRIPLAQLTDVINAAADKPTLILGDFNTPAGSVLLEPLRSHYSLAFDQAGQGYQPTWPIPCPVLSLDQIWASSSIEITSCRHLWTMASDHRPVFLTVRPLPASTVLR